MQNEPFRAEALIDDHGILRWVSNNQCVPMDCLDDNAPAGYDRVRHYDAVQRDIAAFMADYAANLPKRSPENLAEIRAELGPDAIDVITGERIFK